MRLMKSATLLVAALALSAGLVYAGSGKEDSEDNETTKLFPDVNQSAGYFKRSVGYAVFPTIGKGGLGVGALIAGWFISPLIGVSTINEGNFSLAGLVWSCRLAARWMPQ